MSTSNPYAADILSAARLPLPWHKLSGSRILVAGATGLIGSCLVKVLMARADCQIVALGRNRKRASQLFSKILEFSEISENSEYSENSDPSKPSLTFLSHDVTLPLPECGRFDYIIDCASSASPQLYATDPVGVMKGNIFGVDHLLQYGIGHGMRRFLYVSSGEVYGEGDGREFAEDYSGFVDTLSPRSCYPSSKRAAETLCAAYAQQYGVETVVARPCHVYGAGFSDTDHRVYAEFIRNVLRGEDIVMKSRGEQYRSWCYDVDCAAALLFILLKGKSGEAYNIADASSNITIRQLAEMVAEIGRQRLRIELPSDVERQGYNPVSRSVFATEKLQSLGWRPLHDMRTNLITVINERQS